MHDRRVKVLGIIFLRLQRSGGGDGGHQRPPLSIFHSLLPFLFPFDAFDVVVDPISVVFPNTFKA